MNKYIFVVVSILFFSFGLTYAVPPNILPSRNNCYAQRDLSINYDIVFEAMKDMFLKSNINIKNLSKEDGFISGTGVIRTEDGVYILDITVTFKKRGDITRINTNVSYSKLEEDRRVSNVGIGGVIIPIPTWLKDLNLKETGNIDDPNFYIGFYLNFQKALFDTIVRSDKILLKEGAGFGL